MSDVVTFKVARPDAARIDGPRFAVGKGTGSLFVIANPGGWPIRGRVIVGKESLKGHEGREYVLDPDEVLPIGSIITINA